VNLNGYHGEMPTTDLSIGREPVLDFDCSGWPVDKREELSRAIRAIQGVSNVGGAGVSTVRVRYDPSIINPSALTLAVARAADDILPGYNRLGRSNLIDLDRDLRNDLAAFMDRYSNAVREAASAYPNWSSTEPSDKAERRMTLARILTDPASFDGAAAGEAESLRTRYLVLTDALSELGCFFLHRGAIENYYTVNAAEQGKPDLAALEAATFETIEPAILRDRYADLAAALVHIAPNQRVDEDLLLRPKLGAVLTSAFLGMQRDSSDDRLNAIARTTVGSDAEVFRLSNRSKDDLRIGVEMGSPLFQRDTFPFEIGREDNPTLVVPEKLPGIVSS
jgi:hypothetical protein